MHARNPKPGRKRCAGLTKAEQFVVALRATAKETAEPVEKESHE